MDNTQKEQVNQAWQEQIAKEKIRAKERNSTYHEPSFSLFISSVGMQAMIALGKMESPISSKKEKNLEQARFLIDTLAILQEKTKNHLTQEEEFFLSESLCKLRQLYIAERGNEDGSGTS